MYPKKNPDKNRGYNCKCYASSYNECGCGADWTDYHERDKAIDAMTAEIMARTDVEVLEKLIWEKDNLFIQKIDRVLKSKYTGIAKAIQKHIRSGLDEETPTGKEWENRRSPIVLIYQR